MFSLVTMDFHCGSDILKQKTSNTLRKSIKGIRPDWCLSNAPNACNIKIRKLWVELSGNVKCHQNQKDLFLQTFSLKKIITLLCEFTKCCHYILLYIYIILTLSNTSACSATICRSFFSASCGDKLSISSIWISLSRAPYADFLPSSKAFRKSS